MAEATITASEFISNFESIGDNCEFGLIQRYCGAEPLGLFRFNSSHIQNLIAVLATRLADYATDSDVDAFVDANGDYTFRSHKYRDFNYHTHKSASKFTLERIRAQELGKLSYLKERFLSDIDTAEKIFIRKGAESSQDMAKLHAVLRSHGPNVLLWVSETNNKRLCGHVEKLGEGFYRGYISRYLIFHEDQPADLENWLRICLRVYKLSKPRAERKQVRFAEHVAGGECWRAGPDARHEVARHAGRGAFARRSTRLTFRRDVQEPGALAYNDFKGVARPRSIMMVSVPLWIPPDFVGHRVELSFSNTQVFYSHRADLTIRNKWQTIWATTKIPRDATDVVCELRAAGSKGSVIYVGECALKAGVAPAPPPPPLYLNPWAKVEPFAARSMMAGVTKKGPRRRLFLRFVRALIAHGRFETAESVLSEALDRNPGDPALLHLYALSACNSGRFGTAIGRWEEAFNADPDNALAATGFVAGLRCYGLVDRAADAMGNVLNRFPDDVATIAEAARVAEALKLYEEAITLWDRIVGLPGAALEWSNRRHVCLQALPRPPDMSHAPSTDDIATRFFLASRKPDPEQPDLGSPELVAPVDSRG